jgi:DUF4097 and DUF4098 domain-containing protein YvlB
MQMKKSVVVTALVFGCAILAHAQRQEFKYNVGQGAGVTVYNEYGPVTVRPSAGRQVVVIANRNTDKIEIDGSQSGNRVEVRTHLLERMDANQGRVEYDVHVPADVKLSVHSATGPIRIERMRGDISIEGESAQVELRDSADGHVHIRTVNGPITLTNFSNGHLDVTSVGGDVTLTSVSGHKVVVNTNSGRIRYQGEFGGSGDYSLMNNSGDIEVVLPASASLDITASSVKGKVENEFPFTPKAHNVFPAAAKERTFAGTSNRGGSAVRLRSFSGTIRVRKS